MAPKKTVLKKKIQQTPDFVKGLLESADLIADGLPNSPRWLAQGIAHGKRKVSNLDSEQRQDLGKYQGRVVLAGLAAELALKWLWEWDNHPRSSKGCHDLLILFNELSEDLKEKVRAAYLQRACPSEPGWESADEVFNICRNAFVDWRYVVEEGGFKDYVMHATYLNHATRSVLQIGEIHPKEEQP